MNNSHIALRALIIYAICLPLAIFLGYLLANPLNYSTLVTVGVVAFLMVFPLLMKWHYPLLLLSWNMSLVVFFLKGNPSIWYVMVLLSLGISILERALSRQSDFIYVKQVFWPLVCLLTVILVTAKLTGGFGLRSMGSDVYGGRKYIEVMIGIGSFFALTLHPIPLERARLYVSLFFLGGTLAFIGDLYPITPSAFRWIFSFFPPVSTVDEFELGVTRLRGVGATAFAVYCLLMARYGLRDLFLTGSKFRLLLFILSVVLSMMGGFRSTMLLILATFAIQFFMEGLHRTRLLPVFVLLGLLGGVLMVPFASKLPFTFQRALAFLPLDLSVQARMDAANSSNWRVELWKSVLPQVPEHLLLGKGYAIAPEDFQMMGYDVSFKSFDPSQQGLALSMDYHSGPLSLLIPFGIWGALAFCWFVAGAWWVLWRNYKYGDPALRVINIFLFAKFVVSAFMFFVVVGALNSDIGAMGAGLGLSIALNHGVRKPAAQPVEAGSGLGGSALPFRPRHSLQR